MSLECVEEHPMRETKKPQEAFPLPVPMGSLADSNQALVVQTSMLWRVMDDIKRACLADTLNIDVIR